MKTITAKQYRIMMKKGGQPDGGIRQAEPVSIVTGRCVMCGHEAKHMDPECLCRGCGKVLTATAAFHGIRRKSPDYTAVEYRQALQDSHGTLTDAQVAHGIERIGA